jgi:hypothetical protein
MTTDDDGTSNGTQFQIWTYDGFVQQSWNP